MVHVTEALKVPKQIQLCLYRSGGQPSFKAKHEKEDLRSQAQDHPDVWVKENKLSYGKINQDNFDPYTAATHY